MTIKEIIKKLHTTMVDARGEDSHFQSWLIQNEGICDAIDALKELDKQEQGEPVAWKLMPRDATDAMLKAMDECSTEGYDERLYAGHAASVYMAAWDALDTHPPQRKPLTDEQKLMCWARATCDADVEHKTEHQCLMDYADEIEAAHGIKE
jgi:hypothetical protein